MTWSLANIRAAPALTLVAVLAILTTAAGYFLTQTSGRAPPGFAKANGRMEVERVDVAAKYAGRVAQMLVREGDDINRGSTVAELDATELRAQLDHAKASAQRAREGIARAEAELALREAEHKLSEQDLSRITELERRQVGTTADLHRRTAQHAVAEANILGAKAAIADAKAATVAASAQVAQIEAQITEMTLRAPVSGRIEYKLVQPGTVVAGGARVATILDLSDVYMTIFLPTAEAGRVALGSEARIRLDAAPTRIIPASVSFVAAEAQFTPKTVETANEREKLMYRVKLKIDPALLDAYRPYVKAGLTGEAYVRTDAAAVWPKALTAKVSDAR